MSVGLDLEIPFERDRRGHYRFFEILPGAITWTMLALPFVLSWINVTLAAIMILAYLIISFTRLTAMFIRSFHGFSRLKHYKAMDWNLLLGELEAGIPQDQRAERPKWHCEFVDQLAANKPVMAPSDMMHAIIIATYNESRETLEPTIQSVLASNYDMDKVIFVLAYEERGGRQVKKQAQQLVEDYKDKFKYAFSVEHPKDIPGEVIGKGGNITFAGRRLKNFLEEKNIDFGRVIVTTLDADNRPDRQYLAALSYTYAVYDKPHRASVQPVSMYTNNIWDAPAPMRVIATGNSLSQIILAVRPHILRNFSSHAQTMKALIDTDFWSVRTIVEDGHQFWRSYFRYDGDYRVLPLFVPIYQDAVLSSSYKKTLKMQFIQLRRWTWGVSDFAYIIEQAYFRKSKAPKIDKLFKALRHLEGHVNWAVGPLLLLFAGFLPALINPQSYAANELPIIVSNIQTVALAGGLATVYVCFKTLPPKPARYTRRRTWYMVLQWAYMPLMSITYNAMAALYSQTRLMLGLYLSKFDVTEKTVISNEGKAKNIIGNQ